MNQNTETDNRKNRHEGVCDGCERTLQVATSCVAGCQTCDDCEEVWWKWQCEVDAGYFGEGF